MSSPSSLYLSLFRAISFLLYYRRAGLELKAEAVKGRRGRCTTKPDPGRSTICGAVAVCCRFHSTSECAMAGGCSRLAGRPCHRAALFVHHLLHTHYLHTTFPSSLRCETAGSCIKPHLVALLPAILVVRRRTHTALRSSTLSTYPYSKGPAGTHCCCMRKSFLAHGVSVI